MQLAPDFQHQIQIYKWIIAIHATMATKTSYHQRFYKNGIFSEKGIFKATYLLPAQQHMNNFKHILHNIHMQYKHKIIVFKIPDNSYHGNRNCQKWVYPIAKNVTKNEFCPRKMWNWHFSDWLCDTSFFDNIYYRVCLKTDISGAQKFSKKWKTCNLYYVS